MQEIVQSREPGHPQGDAPTIDERACQAPGYGRGDPCGRPGIGRGHARFNHLPHSPTESKVSAIFEFANTIKTDSKTGDFERLRVNTSEQPSMHMVLVEPLEAGARDHLLNLNHSLENAEYILEDA